MRLRLHLGLRLRRRGVLIAACSATTFLLLLLWRRRRRLISAEHGGDCSAGYTKRERCGRDGDRIR
jgi:hypothetical protein